MSIGYYWQIPPTEPQQFSISRELHRLLFHSFNEGHDDINEGDEEFRNWTTSLTETSISKLKLLATSLRCMSPNQKDEAKEIEKMIDAIDKHGAISLTYGY